MRTRARGAPPLDARDLLRSYVEAHNEGGKTGDFSRLAGLLDPDCQMHFKVARAGPYAGSAAVIQAFRQHPPGADLHIAEVTGNPSRAKAHYGWVGAAAPFSGTLFIDAGPRGIRRIDVREFGP